MRHATDMSVNKRYPLPSADYGHAHPWHSAIHAEPLPAIFERQAQAIPNAVLAEFMGRDFTYRELYAEARRFAAGLIERVAHFVKLGGFVACTPDFYDQPKVINGASDLMYEVFGDPGKHARSAVGVPALPLNAAVEVDAIVALKA